MIEPSPIPLALLAGAQAEAKAYLRIDSPDEDALIDQMLGQAAALAEAFTAQMLFTRPCVEIVPAAREWTQISTAPVRAITAVDGLPLQGAAFALPVDAYAIDIDASGRGWVRVPSPGGASRVRVTMTAGLAPGWTSLPDPVRLGILRLAAHFYTHRDAPDDAGPPAAVAALLRPWRRMRLT